MTTGSIVQVIGAVVDVEFARDAMPRIFHALTVDNTDITLEVQQQLGDGVVRTIALGSTDGLKRGLKVSNTGAAITVPVGEKTLGRVMDVLGRPIDEAGPIGEDKRMPIHRKPPSYEECYSVPGDCTLDLCYEWYIPGHNWNYHVSYHATTRFAIRAYRNSGPNNTDQIILQQNDATNETYYCATGEYLNLVANSRPESDCFP